MNLMSSRQFSVFRIIFGIYLTIHFLMLVPHAGELFSSSGIMANAALNPAPGLFPNPLNVDLPVWQVRGVVLVLSIFSLVFTLGFLRPLVSIFLWFGWTALFHRNQLIANPSLAYIGLLLALCALVPGGEKWSLSKGNPDWAMPVWVLRTAWILLAAGYTFSGIIKLSSPSWIDGSAMAYLMENPLARPGILREVMMRLPWGLLSLLTWFTLAVELLYLPLACWKKSRPWIWLVMVVLHIGIIFVVDFADLSLGMLMVHALTFDRKWLVKFGVSKSGAVSVNPSLYLVP